MVHASHETSPVTIGPEIRDHAERRQHKGGGAGEGQGAEPDRHEAEKRAEDHRREQRGAEGVAGGEGHDDRDGGGDHEEPDRPDDRAGDEAVPKHAHGCLLARAGWGTGAVPRGTGRTRGSTPRRPPLPGGSGAAGRLDRGARLTAPPPG